MPAGAEALGRATQSQTGGMAGARKISDSQRRVGGGGESSGAVKPKSLGQYSRESIPVPPVREFVE
jgi:hypothetical protein